MNYNVAQLLKEPIGSERRFRVEEALGAVGQPARRATGAVRMVRTHQGIWVQAALTVEVGQDCSRCLADFSRTLDLELDEEYFPEVDIRTGRRMTPPEDWEGMYIGSDHILDLDEAARQSALAALPLKPLCQPDCAGMCDRCGANRNGENCNCDTDEIDPRWAALRPLLAEPTI